MTTRPPAGTNEEEPPAGDAEASKEEQSVKSGVGLMSQTLSVSLAGMVSSAAGPSSNSAIGMRARLWRVDQEKWLKFSGEVSGDESMLRNVSAAYNNNLHVPEKSQCDTSVCGLPVIDPYHWIVSVWTRFIILFDMSYTAFLVPVSVGFQTNERHQWNAIIDIVAGIIFVLALFMGFHIGFIAQFNLRRMVVKNGAHVAEYYMHCGSFVIDLISVLVYLIQIAAFVINETVGIDETNLVVFWVMNAVQILRMVRLYSVFGVVKYLLISASTGGSQMLRRWLKPAILYTAVIAYMLAFVVNATASLWFYVGSWYAYYNHDNWIAKFIGEEAPCTIVFFAWQFPNPSVPVDCQANTVMTFYESYFLSIYWSVTTLTTVGYGDITPSNIGEVIVAIIVMLIGIMSFAVLIGSMQEVFKTASETAKNVSLLREKLEAVDHWLHKRHIPKSIQSQIRRFYHEAWLQREQDYMESEIFEELPHQLRAVVAQHQTAQLLADIRVFSSLSSEERKIVASKLVPITLGVGQDVCCQGDFADRMWILQEGTMVAIYGDKVAEVERAPELICETSILADVDPQFDMRPCGYRSATTCVLWELKMRDLRALVGQFPYLKRTLDREVSLHVLQRAGLFPDALGAYNMDRVREASKALQMSTTIRGEINLEDSDSSLEDAVAGRCASIPLMGVGEVNPECLETLATQVNQAVLGSPTFSPTHAEEPADDREEMPGKPMSSPSRFAPINVRMPSQNHSHGAQSPDVPAVGSPSDVSVALRDILRYIKGMEARLVEMEAVTSESSGSPVRPRFGSPVKRLGSRGTAALPFAQLRL